MKSMQQKGINSTNQELFEQFRLGKMNMKNRFVMPSLNRMRANKKTGVTDGLIEQYYTQRYHNGLIITEGCLVSDDYNPYPGQPGIYNKEQTDGWLEVVDRVHSRATNIVAQLFHPGRVISPSQLPQSIHSISSSSLPIEGTNKFSYYDSFAVPKSMNTLDIKRIIQCFKNAAINAKNAGFDGIQIEAGNGFLIDQFLRDSCNQRNDEYGGSIENRCRLCLEIVDEILTVLDSEQISIKISPISQQYSMNDSKPFELMAYLLNELGKRNLAFIEVRKVGYLDIITTKQSQDIDISQDLTDPMPDFFKQMRLLYKGNMIANSDFETIEEANRIIKELGYQAVAFDILSINNPDLPQRIKEKGNINHNLRTVFIYKGRNDGYVDYPYYIAHSRL